MTTGEDPIAAEDREFVDALLGRGQVRVPYEEAPGEPRARLGRGPVRAHRHAAVEPAAVLRA